MRGLGRVGGCIRVGSVLSKREEPYSRAALTHESGSEREEKRYNYRYHRKVGGTCTLGYAREVAADKLYSASSIQPVPVTDTGIRGSTHALHKANHDAAIL
jgi:hypothetical protein